MDIDAERHGLDGYGRKLYWRRSALRQHCAESRSLAGRPRDDDDESCQRLCHGWVTASLRRRSSSGPAPAACMRLASVRPSPTASAAGPLMLSR